MPDRTCEHRLPGEDPCGAEAPYIVSVGHRRHDAQASCERHLGDTVAALAYAEEPPPDVTVTAPAPLLRALTDAADARDRFREQARILGEAQAEWLCEACECIHPWRDGDRFTADCPECGYPMVPTSMSARALQEARGRAEAAEGKLAALAAEWHRLGEEEAGMSLFRSGYRAALRKCADELSYEIRSDDKEAP